MSGYCPDNYDQWKKHDREQTRWYNSLPRCEYCRQKIQDEDLMDIEGTLYHVECAEREFKRNTEDYMV